MTKDELRNDLISNGYTVQPVAEWQKVSEVENVSKYDLNVVDSDDNFFTAQVKVVDDGESGETATKLNALAPKEPGFAENLESFLRTQEGNLANVFALSSSNVNNTDRVAEVLAYNTDNTTQKYVVKERDGTFEFQQTN